VVLPQSPAVLDDGTETSGKVQKVCLDMLGKGKADDVIGTSVLPAATAACDGCISVSAEAEQHDITGTATSLNTSDNSGCSLADQQRISSSGTLGSSLETKLSNADRERLASDADMFEEDDKPLCIDLNHSSDDTEDEADDAMKDSGNGSDGRQRQMAVVNETD
jgi:hypothetical protein